MQSFFVPKWLDTVDASVDVNTTSIQANFLNRVSFVVVVTGTLVGTVELQVSNERQPNGNIEPGWAGQERWAGVPDGPLNIDAGMQTNNASPPFDIAYGWIRIVWTHTSGTGNITVDFAGFRWP